MVIVAVVAHNGVFELMCEGCERMMGGKWICVFCVGVCVLRLPHIPPLDPPPAATTAAADDEGIIPAESGKTPTSSALRLSVGVGMMSERPTRGMMPMFWVLWCVCERLKELYAQLCAQRGIAEAIII